ncbi:MAG: hypothetical protein JO112_23560 [Planctomycetes bacterium]|nr:hypothetical protein [Planctomycetota bacterium]
MADRSQEPEYLVRLKALPGPVPGPIRLRKFLKAALRSFGLKCLDVSEVPPPGEPEEPPTRG